jgi:hypothetical protein
MTAEGSLLPRKTGLEALELTAFKRQRKGCSLEVSQPPALQRLVGRHLPATSITLRQRSLTSRP